MAERALTKSRFVLGKRCQKALYLKTHSPQLACEESNLDKKTKREGTEVGAFARTYFPGGIHIETLDTEEALAQTAEAIAQRAHTLYEAAFRYHNIVIRADILTRNAATSSWDLYEVKATTYKNISTSEKEAFQRDLALQTWVLQKCGLDLKRVYLLHLNRDCVYPDLEDLFTKKDYWSEIQSILPDIEKDAQHLQLMLTQEVEPNISIGHHCDHPRKCEFKGYCWKQVPPYSVFCFPRFRKQWDFLKEGRFHIEDLKESDFSTLKHRRILKCYQDEKPYLDREGIRTQFQAWEHPISYFDLEAVSYPIPRYERSRPYQDLPFQYSCHIQYREIEDLEHHEFLWDNQDDPRPAFIQHLLQTIPEKGAIVVYHQTYELTRLKELAEDFPDFATPIRSLMSRIVDLKKVIEDCVYYPEFKGSFSIKKVAPVLLGDQADYKHLAVSDGIEAVVNFQNMIQLDASDPQRAQIRKNLLEYCKQDTLLMVYLHRILLQIK